MYRKIRISAYHHLFLLLAIAVSLAGCNPVQATPALLTVMPGQGAATAAKTAAPATPATATPAPTPTATPEPLALRVNDQGISLAEYQAELGQLQEALKTLNKTLTPEQQRQQVLDNLTDTLLLAQGAQADGYQADDAAIQAEIDRLGQQLGGAQAVQAWATQRGYTEAAFRAALARQLAAAWERDKIAASVPTTAEQIHARQILTTDESVANRALEQVKVPGTDFAAYAFRYDAQTGGDLGWFPRGYLTQPEVEAAAFQLQPGEISPVIKSAIGYHIIQVIARDPARPLTPDARRVLQHKALQDWLTARRATSKIEVLAP